MSESMSYIEAMVPWAIVVGGSILTATVLGMDVLAVAPVSPWMGLIASVLWINYRFSGSPFRLSQSRSDPQ